MALTVGQKVIVKSWRHNKPIEYAEATVAKVGRKYFYLSSEELWWLHQSKFLTEDLSEVTKYSTKYRIYLNLSEVVDEELGKILATHIVLKLSPYGYNTSGQPKVSTDKLIAMVKVLDPSCVLLQDLASALPSIPGSREYLRETYGINTEDSQKTISVG